MKWFRRLQAAYFVSTNRMARAAPLYREILKTEPTHTLGLFTVLADCLERGDADAAIEVSGRALKVDGQHFYALQTLGWAYVTRGDHQAARPVVARALEQFDALGLGHPSRTLRAIDRAASAASAIPGMRARIHVPPGGRAGAVVGELEAWKAWAIEYLQSTKEAERGQ